MSPAPRERTRVVLRYLAALAFVAVGALHFIKPDNFTAIVPSWLPAPLMLVYISGVAEIAGGVGLLIPQVRRIAGFGLLLLLLAVFPANINMAVNEIAIDGQVIPTWALWLRLPFQFVFAAWIWFVMGPQKTASDA